MENKSKNIIIILLAIVVLVLVVFLVLNINKKDIIIKDEVKGEIVLVDIEEKIKTEAPEWSKYWIGKDSGSNLSMFIKSGEKGSITGTEYPYDFEANKLREKRFYIYSPDKTKIIDPNGQIALYEENGKILEGLDVDSSVRLIDVKTSKFKQILSCGTPCGFSDAVWIDDSNFVVLGGAHDYKENGNCKIYKECQYPILYIFDLSKNEYALYQGPERLLVTEEETPSKETYIYKNHGFTIELSKNRVPSEQPVAGIPYENMIYFGDGNILTYITDVSLRESQKEKMLSNYNYLRDEKIGITTFKVYSYNGSTLYYFRQGNVGYEYIGDKELLKTFKFVGWN